MMRADSSVAAPEPGRIHSLFHGSLETEISGTRRALVFCILCIVLGSSAYGASIGLWRSPLQALYVSMKFPILLLATTAGTGFLNWLLATLLGLPLSFARSLRFSLTSFAIASLILGSLSPIALFFLYNTPPLGSASTRTAYSGLLVFHVLLIAFAGIIANVRLFRLLLNQAGTHALALRVFVCWLAANLVFGSQLSWNLRPFFGAPQLPVQFVRPNAFEGNFFEALHHASRNLTQPTKGKRNEREQPERPDS